MGKREVLKRCTRQSKNLRSLYFLSWPIGVVFGLSTPCNIRENGCAIPAGKVKDVIRNSVGLDKVFFGLVYGGDYPNFGRD